MSTQLKFIAHVLHKCLRYFSTNNTMSSVSVCYLYSTNTNQSYLRDMVMIVW